MRQLQDIAQERQDMFVILQLTSAFEGLASMRITQIKNQVLQAQNFFNELWQIYSQIRADSLFRFGRKDNDVVIDKELYIVITASGGFSGDIDQRLISEMLTKYDKDKQDIIIIGHHGAVLLTQLGVAFKKYYNLPEKDQDINVEPLVREIRQYRNAIVYYQAYISLMAQEIKRIELNTTVKELGEKAGKNEEVISEQTYIFEPSAFDVIAHLERSMLQIALSQVILDSKLAQYASRFRAMSASSDKADESLGGLTTLLNRTRRTIRDARLKQIINGTRKVQIT
jgi:ATP synthase F1 gamma subunit